MKCSIDGCLNEAKFKIILKMSNGTFIIIPSCEFCINAILKKVKFDDVIEI